MEGDSNILSDGSCEFTLRNHQVIKKESRGFIDDISSHEVRQVDSIIDISVYRNSTSIMSDYAAIYSCFVYFYVIETKHDTSE